MQKHNLLIWAVAVVLLFGVGAKSQSKPNLDTVTHSSSFKFVGRDGTCVYGKISKVDGKSITVQPFDKPAVTFPKDDLLQVSQGNALLYSARSSWTDVSGAVLYPHEALVLTLKNDKQVRGKPSKVSSDSITLRHGFH